jgi:FkbM family methyltransferase
MKLPLQATGTFKLNLDSFLKTAYLSRYHRGVWKKTVHQAKQRIESIGRRCIRQLRKGLPPATTGVFDWVRAILDPYAVSAYSQEGEDIILSRLFEEQPCGFYVDVGAYHPQRFSNTYLFYKRGWKGINIDPNVDSIAAFRRFRQRDINLAIGISNEVGELHYHRFNEPALNTFDEVLASERSRIPGYHLLSTITVPVTRLDVVLQEHLPRNERIDFLSVDTEGYDLKVLRSNDWSRFHPRCVLVEISESSLHNLSLNPIHTYLAGAGYDVFAKTVNTLIYLARNEPTQELSVP